jgi:hypothetical protein
MENVNAQDVRNALAAGAVHTKRYQKHMCKARCLVAKLIFVRNSALASFHWGGHPGTFPPSALRRLRCSLPDLHIYPGPDLLEMTPTSGAPLRRRLDDKRTQCLKYSK